tara:strand:- start:67 stop:453 length:387 start_codon:yes stop_codon:yes gene_type:complete
MDEVYNDVVTSNAYQKKYRLRSPVEFKKAFNSINRKQSGKFFTFLCSNNNLPFCRLGLIVPKKHIPLAVDRNKIKRRTREFFRCNIKDNLSFENQFDVIVLTKPPAKLLAPKQINQELTIQWNKLIKK